MRWDVLLLCEELVRGDSCQHSMKKQVRCRTQDSQKTVEGGVQKGVIFNKYLCSRITKLKFHNNFYGGWVEAMTPCLSPSFCHFGERMRAYNESVFGWVKERQGPAYGFGMCCRARRVLVGGRSLE